MAVNKFILISTTVTGNRNKGIIYEKQGAAFLTRGGDFLKWRGIGNRKWVTGN